MSSLRGRLLGVAATTLIVLVGMPGVANASGVGLAPYFVEYGTGMSTYVGQSGSTKIPIGVMTWGSGTATGVKLTADLSRIASKVDIVGVSSPCSRSGSTVTCNFGTLAINGEKKIGATLSLRAKPDAAAGPAGKVYLKLVANPTPGTSSASGTVDVRPDVADLVMTSTVPTVQIGQTATISHTVKNLGPAAQPEVTLGAGGVQPGTRYAGGEGCTTTSTTFNCRIENLAVGQTRVVKVKVKVNGCDTSRGMTGPGEGWGAAVNDPNMYNNDFRVLVRVAGCPGPTGTSSGGSSGSSGSGSDGSSKASPKPSTGASAAPSVVPSVVPVLTLTSSPSIAPHAVAEVAATTSGTSILWPTAGLTVGLAALIGLVWRWRRRDTSGAAEPPSTE